MGRRALVTGGAGFIGSHLVRRLLAEGWEVRVLDNLSTGDRGNLDEIREKVEFLDGDIRDAAAVRSSAAGVDCIWHQAAMASVPRSVADPVLTHDVNVNGTLNVLLAARDLEVPRTILASSSSVYGETPVLPKVESMTPEPLSPYAVHKLVGEQYARQFYLHYGVTTICLRYFNVFGPRQNPDGPYAAVLPRFVERIRAGKKPLVYGSGKQTRDFTYVDNAVEANLLATIAQPERVGGRAYNIASGAKITVLELAEATAKLLGWEGGVEFAPARAGDIEHSHADIGRATTDLGYRPVKTFEEGLRLTLSS